MLTIYSISRQAFDALMRRAVANGKRRGREICGLLVAHANVLTPIPLRNKVKGGGSWAFYSREVRQAVAMAERGEGEVVGTFHSHPIGLPEPGTSDIENGQRDSLMLIVDCLDKKWGLWHIDGGEAKRLRLVRRRLTTGSSGRPKKCRR